ncbi:MAG: NusA-like transcription termination signal-binding factor [DPANN group archaeon]|nr:NusA-like transcription termination signal-binding factor [DPANN group archaeon]
MTKIKYDFQLMRFMSLFERVTRASLHDCYEDHNQTMVFVVKKGELGKALGKKAANVHKLSELLKRKVRIVQFDEDICRFVANLIYPLKAERITLDDENIVIQGGDTKTKGLLIGRDFRNLKQTTNIVKRYFPIRDMKVV